MSSHAKQDIPLPFNQAIEQFDLHLQRQERADKTRSEFVSDVTSFAIFLAKASPPEELAPRQMALFTQNTPEPALPPVTVAKPAHIHAYLASQGATHAPKTIQRRLTSLRVFFDWLHRSNLIPDNPAIKVPYPEIDIPLPAVLSPHEIERILSAARALAHPANPHTRPDPRCLAIITVILDTGMKRNELLGLRENNILWSTPEKPASLRISHEQRHLAFKSRIVPISTASEEALRALIRSNTKRHRAGNPSPASLRQRAALNPDASARLFTCTGRSIENLLHHIARQAGLDRGLTCEQLRWTGMLRDYLSGRYSEETLAARLGLSEQGWRHAREKLDRLAGRRS